MCSSHSHPSLGCSWTAKRVPAIYQERWHDRKHTWWKQGKDILNDWRVHLEILGLNRFVNWSSWWVMPSAKVVTISSPVEASSPTTPESQLWQLLSLEWSHIWCSGQRLRWYTDFDFLACLFADLQDQIFDNNITNLVPWLATSQIICNADTAINLLMFRIPRQLAVMVICSWSVPLEQSWCWCLQKKTGVWWTTTPSIRWLTNMQRN